MSILTVVLGISVLFNIALLFAIRNHLRNQDVSDEHIDHLEYRISRFYTGTQDVLMNMRAIDRDEMFEKDDDVGTLFTQLTEIIGELRILLYGEEEEEQHILDERD